MIRSRLGLKALGLCAMVLGLMAFSASVAQAEKGANWMVNGNNITDTLLPGIQVTEVENKTISLLTKIAGATVAYLCTGMELVGVKLLLEGSLSLGDAKFTGCITLINGKVSAVCVPKTAGQPAGTILSENFTGLIVLDAEEGVIKISPDNEKLLFATLSFNVAEGCALPEKVPVLGHIVFKDCKGATSFRTEAVSHLIEQNLLTHLYVISDTAEHAANIDGSIIVALTGEHKGLKWSGLPA